MMENKRKPIQLHQYLYGLLNDKVDSKAVVTIS